MDATSLGEPLDVRPLLAPERQALLDLLSRLDPESWTAPTPCPQWSVHELAVHLIHDDLRRLAAHRDHHHGVWIPAASLDELAAALNEANNGWVATMASSLSPRLTRELLSWLSEPTEAHLCSLDPQEIGDTVTWAGGGPHPNWLDVAREYTERWVHQQQLREAVSQPGLDEWRFLESVLDTFARALPACLPPRPEGVEVQLHVSEPHPRSWTARASNTGWGLVEPYTAPAAVVTLSADGLWRRAVRMLTHEAVSQQAESQGDPGLVAAVLNLRAAIVSS